MARTIEDIKSGMTSEFMRNTDVARRYGFNAGEAFSDHFSRVSVENLIFYIVAVATWTLESLMDIYRADVENRIEEIIPHRPKWYRDKVLLFMPDMSLIPDTDRYDTSALTETQIHERQVVKYATAEESEDASLLIIKVAGESGGERQPIDDASRVKLEAYLREIKDAGVRISVINKEADIFSCELKIVYDGKFSADTVEADCREAVKQYITNLPFNGEYSNMALVDCLQEVEGVNIAEVIGSKVKVIGEETETMIEVRYVPSAGYFSLADDSIIVNMIRH